MTKCIGCGIELQNKDENELGYTNDLSNNICTRCFKLKHYGEYKKVELNNKDYQKIINNIPDTSLVLYTVDILSFNLDLIKLFKKVVLVITKKDILPKSTKEYKIINKLKESYPNLIDIIMVSSKNNYNLDELHNKIKDLSNNKPIYVVGYTNTGKSTLINKLIKNYSDNNTQITESMYPSTTLDTVKIELNNLTIIDTPGLIDESNIINYLTKEQLKKVLPQSSINPKTCQINNSGSILIEDLLRIDYKTNTTNSIVIYSSPKLKINFASKDNNTLKDNEPHIFKTNNNEDIVIPGLCFIKTTKPIDLTIYTLDKVKPYLRNIKL